MPRKRKQVDPDTVPIRVEIYRATDEEAEGLIDFVESCEAVDRVETPKRKASGLLELGTLFYVYLKPYLVAYAANKTLDVVYDTVSDWFKKKKAKKGWFVRVSSTSGKKVRQIGKGKPKRER